MPRTLLRLLSFELLLVTVEQCFQDAKNVEDLGVVRILQLKFIDDVEKLHDALSPLPQLFI